MDELVGVGYFEFDEKLAEVGDCNAIHIKPFISWLVFKMNSTRLKFPFVDEVFNGGSR